MENKDVIPCNIISSTEIKFCNNEKFIVKGFETFDAFYSERNAKLASKLGMSEDEAFIYGNFGKYWTSNILKGRKIRLFDNDIQYYKYKYSIKFKNSPYSFIDGKPLNPKAYEREISKIRRGDFVLFDIDEEKYYPVSKENAKNLKNFVVVRKSHIKKSLLKQNKKENRDYFMPVKTEYKTILDLGNIKFTVTDHTSKILPDRNCSSDICREILTNINNSKKSIDMAIYGYSSTPDIEKAIISAQKRGVKFRLVYDTDINGKNIYSDTEKLIKLIPDNNTDKNNPEQKNIMHNKFFIIDEKTVITGSANLSHTDMSGFNSNSIIVINSEKIAQIYKKEFEQMFSGKFHNTKNSVPNKIDGNIKVYFSPQDKTITNGILPLIKNAKHYIYISSFIITERNFSNELINAKNRGADIKLIVDALNATNSKSKHKIFRNSGILVKAENYAGKMHSKSIVIDDEYVVIGSMNFSNSGENYNDENTIIIKNKQLAEFYRKFFLYQWDRIPNKWLKYTPRAEGADSIGSCTDGIDNNYDGMTDYSDSACKKQ